MGRLTRLSALLVVCLVMWFAAPALGAIVYVKWNSPTNGPGNDWAHACHTVTAGLAAAVSGDEVWVAGNAANPYVERISLKAGVGLYGGFAGTETARTQRDWQGNVTILDGNRGGKVVTDLSGSTTAVIDGFTIRNGSASGSHGGGVYCQYSSPTIRNNTITGNYAGGIGCRASDAVISNNVITANSTAGSDGGIYCYDRSYVTISGNTITDNGGDGVGSTESHPALSNNIIKGNDGCGIYVWNPYYPPPGFSPGTALSAPDAQVPEPIKQGYGPSIITGNVISGNLGDGVYLCNSGYTVTNNTITANSSAGIRLDGENPDGPVTEASNNIVAFNHDGLLNWALGSGIRFSLRNNCIYNPGGINYGGGVTVGVGDISVDPLLTPDYHLAPCSPCINVGWDSAFYIPACDIDGEQRANGVIDIGGDEYWPYATVDLDSVKSAVGAARFLTSNAVVTAAFADFFYIESDNRVCGIRINKPGHSLTQGMRAYVFGTPATHGGERCIDGVDTHQSTPPNDTGSVAPLAVSNRFLGGFAFGLQPGVTGVWGLNNIDLLVRICGKVVEVEPVTEPAVPTWFKIDDGTGRSIKCLVPSGVTIDPNWDKVTVTGISSCETVGTEIHSLLRVRMQSDIVPH